MTQVFLLSLDFDKLGHIRSYPVCTSTAHDHDKVLDESDNRFLPSVLHHEETAFPTNLILQLDTVLHGIMCASKILHP